MNDIICNTFKLKNIDFFENKDNKIRNLILIWKNKLIGKNKRYISLRN